MRWAVFVLLATLAACASTNTIAIKRDAPTCVAATDRPAPYDAVFIANPESLGRDASPRCDVSRFTVAVRNLGAMREVYGDERSIAADRITARVDEVIGAILDRLCEPVDHPADPGAAVAPDRRCDPGGPTVRLLIYAHGGMVNHERGVRASERLAPAMLADGYEPLFLVWNSDLATAYGQELCCINTRAEATPSPRFWLTIFRAFSDVVAGWGNAPENYVNQFTRYKASVDDPEAHNPRYWLACDAEPPPNCLARKRPDSGENSAANNVIFPPGKTDDQLNAMRPWQTLLGRPRFVVLEPARLATTLASGIGQKSWDNLVGRTQLAFGTDQEPTGIGCADATRRSAATAASYLEEEDNAVREGEPPPGGFAIVFDRLECELIARNLMGRVRITLVGHSMGALIANEIVSRYPELPYERIIYMAAATSIRDFRLTVAPVLAEHATGVCHGSPCQQIQFFSLMLHPLADAREIYYGGVAPEGSLLEWIDEMFQGPRTGEDRMLGKWNNIRGMKGLFTDDLQRVMTFRIFPLDDSVKPSERDCATPPRGGDKPPRCHPIRHGEMSQFSFWRDRYLMGDFAPGAGGQEKEKSSNTEVTEVAPRAR
jgi:hypothetical protein